MQTKRFTLVIALLAILVALFATSVAMAQSNLPSLGSYVVANQPYVGANSYDSYTPTSGRGTFVTSVPNGTQVVFVQVRMDSSNDEIWVAFYYNGALLWTQYSDREHVRFLPVVNALGGTPTMEAPVDIIPEAGDVMVIDRAAEVHVAPRMNSPFTETRTLPQGTVIVVEEVNDEVAGYFWVRHESGWTPFSAGADIFMSPAEMEAPALAESGDQGGGGVLVLNQYPVVVNNAIVGFAHTPQESPAYVNVPEDGYTLWATEIVTGQWTMSVYVGNPDDGTPADLNRTVEVQFTGQALSLMIFGDMPQVEAIGGLTNALLALGADQVVVNHDGQVNSYTALVQNAPDLGLADMADFSALGQSGGMGFVPDGATMFPQEQPFLWAYTIPNSAETVLPLDGRFNYAAFGGATLAVNGWSNTFGSDGTIGNLVMVVRESEDASALLSVTGQSASNFAFINMFGGSETPEQSMAANGRNLFNAPNCGASGCQTVHLYLVYVTDSGVVLFFDLGTYTSADDIADPFPIQWDVIRRG